MNVSRLACLPVVVLATFAVALMIAPSASAEDIILAEIGDHEQTCEASSSVQYEWFVYNSHNVSYLLEMSIDVASGEGWESEFEDEYILLDPGDGASVTLILSATNEVTSEDVNQTVIFTFVDLDDTNKSEVLHGYANTSMIPVWGVIAPGKNKILGMFDNPFPEPFNDNYVTFLISVGLWAMIAVVFMYIIDPIAHIFTKKTKTDLDDRILAIMRKPIFVIVVVYGIVSSFSVLPLSEKDIGEIFVIYGLVMIALVTFVAYKIFKEVLVYLGKRWASKTDSQIDDVLIPVIDKIGGILIMLFGAMSIVTYLGYDVTFLLTGVGVFGLVIAFAAQDALSNFFSGIMLLMDRPFAEGEYITIPTGELCRIEKIGIRSCRLYDVFASDYIVLPNNKLINEKIVNLTKPDIRATANVVVGVAYGSDVPKVERILVEAARNCKNVLTDEDKVPVARFTNFGDSALEFKVFFWVDDFMNQWKAAHEIREEVNKRFAEEGIDIPYPHRTIYIKEMPKTK